MLYNRPSPPHAPPRRYAPPPSDQFPIVPDYQNRGNPAPQTTTPQTVPLLDLVAAARSIA